jgi:hypothetical protein
MNGFIAAIAAFLNGLIFLVGVILSIVLGIIFNNMMGPGIGFAAFFFSFLITVVACSFVAYLSSMRSELVAIRSLLSGVGFGINSASGSGSGNANFEPPASMKGASKTNEWLYRLSHDVDAAREFKRVNSWGEGYADIFAHRYMSGAENAISLANEISKLVRK